MVDLVTGATGFIGSYLAERILEGGRGVRVLCRPGSESKLTPLLAARAEIALGDLRDEASLVAAVAGVDRVFHCAGHVSDWGGGETFVAANVRGTASLYRAARAANVQRVVHFSSIAVFGTPSPPSFDDDSPIAQSRDGYSRTKAEGEAVAREAHREGLPITILRPAVVYGLRGTWFEEPLAMIEQNKMFLLGGGRGTCHPCYIENLVDATLLAAEHPRSIGQAYIVADTDGDGVTFRDYFDAVARVAGRGPVGRSLPLPFARALAIGFETMASVRKKDDRPLLTNTAVDMVTTVSRMSTRKIRGELGWTPRWTFGQAIAELTEKHRARRESRGET